MDLIKISQDKEKAKNILKMIALIEERLQNQDNERMAALIIVDYYEIIKELITAILLIDGYKTLSHKDLLEYLQERYKGIGEYELSLLNDLRVVRNRVAYEGFFVEPSFLRRKEESFKKIIQKLTTLVTNKLR